MRRTFFLAVLLLALTGCGRNMYDQAKFETYDASPFYEDGTSSRPLAAAGGVDAAKAQPRST